ncbi:hypothetical protein CC79DRAFT_1363174 [Sarocladium strictum]
MCQIYYPFVKCSGCSIPLYIHDDTVEPCDFPSCRHLNGVDKELISFIHMYCLACKPDPILYMKRVQAHFMSALFVVQILDTPVSALPDIMNRIVIANGGLGLTQIMKMIQQPGGFEDTLETIGIHLDRCWEDPNFNFHAVTGSTPENVVVVPARNTVRAIVFRRCLPR